MAIEQELRFLLQHARSPVNGNNQQSGDGLGDAKKQTTGTQKNASEELQGQPTGRASAKEIYERLVRVRDQRVLPGTRVAVDANIPELLVLVAEAGIRQQDFDVARACVEWFLSDYTMKNQASQVIYLESHYYNRAMKLRIVLNAIHFIMLVVPVATDPKRRPQYDFLVYNASVTYWQISRQLMKKSTFQYLLPSLSAILDALKSVGEKDVLWLLRLQIALIQATIDAKQLAAAAKSITEIVDVQLPGYGNDPVVSMDPSFKPLYEEALRVQVHIGSFKDPECQKMLSNMKKNTTNKRASLITKLQALKSGVFAGTTEAALTELVQETLGMASFVASTTTDDQIITHLHALDSAAQLAVDAEIIVETGIIAAFRQEYRIASCCDIVLQTKGKNMNPKFRVLHQVLKAIVVALVPPDASANYKLNRQQRASLMIARRIEGVKAMERALLVCKRQQDANLMENVCLYAWNLSLPLLQPDSRGQLTRLFTLAASSLDELQSLQLNLRVRLLLELAKMEVSSDFVSKAHLSINKALAVDYGTMTSAASTSGAAASSPTLDELTAQESKWLHRPVDVHLLPLKKRLDGKLSLEDPSNLNEELASAVEELKDAKDPTQRKKHLDRIVAAIAGMDKEQQQDSGSVASSSWASLDLLLHLNTTSAFVWHEIKDATTARELTQTALALFSQQQHQQLGGEQHHGESVFTDKSVMLLEIDLRLRLVELLDHEMKTRSHKYDAAVAEQSDAQNGQRKNKRGSSNAASRKQPRAKKNESQVDGAALVLLSKESHALGITVTTTGPTSGGGTNQDQEVDAKRTAMEVELISLKKELLHQLAMALQAATKIGWGFVVKNTAVYLWNYHLHVFRLLLGGSGTSIAQAILPECIALFENALAAMEALPATSINQDLLASIALGLALVYEKTGKLDKATSLADTVLKRSKASTTTLPPPGAPQPAGASVLFLKRFAELKVRAQLHQNAKEILPVDTTPQLKVVSFLEAMEATLSQTSSASFASLPPAQQTQLTEKAVGFFQKAMATWQPIAKESLERMRNESLTLEEQQQQLELYCEIWVRLGCGAFRFHNVKQAMTCGERALDPIAKTNDALCLKDHEQKVWVVDATWKWVAMAELLCGRSILALLSGETAAWALIEAVLTHLVRCTGFAARAGASRVIVKACEVAWNVVLTAITAVEAELVLGETSDDGGEVTWWKKLLPLLRDVLSAVGHVSTVSADHFLGDYGLLVLDICEQAGEWKAATEVADSLIHQLSHSTTTGETSADQLKDITTFHAIATATLGATGASTSSSSATGNSKGKDHDAMVQAKILRRIAFSSRRNPPAQLKALAMAHKELEGKPEEQSLVLMDMAAWFYTHRFPLQEVDAHVDVARTILMARQRAVQLKASSSIDGNGSNSSSSSSSSEISTRATTGGSHENELVYSPLFFAMQLVRLFTMRAFVAPTMSLRWECVRNGIHQVFETWQSILDVANDHDLHERFAVEFPAVDETTISFEEWKTGKPTKFDGQCPRTVAGWVSFYQRFATSLTNRFYMQWLMPLTKLSTSDSGGGGGGGGTKPRQTITNPILTCDVLEQLMGFLASFGAVELVLPVVCLYQVVYFAFCPHKCKTMEIWIELTLYDVLEKLNLTVMNVPLQSALEMLQSRGDMLLKELQQQQQQPQDDATERGTAAAVVSRRRTILQLSQVNVVDKLLQIGQLLLQFRFVRQAKVILAMLTNMAERNAAVSADLALRCEALAAQVYEMEGDVGQALASCHRVTMATAVAPLELSAFIKQVLMETELLSDTNKAVSALVAAERVVAGSILCANECVLLHQPMHTHAVSKYLASLTSSSATATPTITMKASTEQLVDLDAVVGLAQLKLRRACLAMGVPNASVATVEHAQRVFREAVELLTLVDSKKARAEAIILFASLVATHALAGDQNAVTSEQRDRWLIEARGLLQEALVLLETLRSRTFEPVAVSCSLPPVMYTTPLDMTIAEVKLQLATLELRLEESAIIVADQQMTWCRYEKDAKRTIVDKWLDQTATYVEIERPGSLSRTFALASAVTGILPPTSEPLQMRGLAQALGLQARRLTTYHHAEKNQRAAIHQFLWTRFTSDHASHATWLCASTVGGTSGSTSVSASAGNEDGRTTPSPSLSESSSAVDLPEILSLELQQTLTTLATDLESELKLAIERRHVEIIRTCAYELVQVYGCSQPLACARALLLYQSAVVREDHMVPLVDKCLAPTNVTRLHLKRLTRLTTIHTNASRNSLPFQLSQLFLEQQSDIYKRMNIAVPVDTALAMLPSHTRVLSLQLSPDRCFLYVVLASSSDKGATTMARMECTAHKRQLLSKLKKRIHLWRDGITKALLSVEEVAVSTTSQQPHSDLHEFTLTSPQDPAAPALAPASTLAPPAAVPDELENEFNAIISDTIEFFGSLFDHSALSGALQSELPGNSLVLIVDRELAFLPLEALPAFDKADGISREFSVHLLYHRLSAVKAHPFRREDVRVIVDPRREDPGLNDQTLTSVMLQATKKSGAAFANWKDAAEHGQVPTTTDWQQAMLLRRGGALWYAGPNRAIGSAVSLQTISGMNLSSSCYALLLLDRAENRTSARQQSKIDSEKPHLELELEEDCYAAALLCSLCGVNVVVMNQWTTTFHGNRRLATGLLHGLAKGQSIAKAVRKYPESAVPVVAAPLGSPTRKVSAATGNASQAAAAARAGKARLKNRFRFNTAVYGLGHLAMKGE